MITEGPVITVSYVDETGHKVEFHPDRLTWSHIELEPHELELVGTLLDIAARRCFIAQGLKLAREEQESD